jgi:hypothetical protein
MISLPVVNQPIVVDTNEDAHIDQNDLNVTLTFTEHEMLVDVLLQAVEMMNFACPNKYFDLPMDSELIQRFSTIENLRERFNEAWTDRFNNNEIH